MVGQIEQVFLQRVESLNEFLAFLVTDEWVDERQPLRDLIPTGVVSGACQLLIPMQRRLPTLELGLQEVGKTILAVRPHFGEQFVA